MTLHIIGDEDTVLGYRFAGVTGDVAREAPQARSAFHAARQNKQCRILLLTEPVAAWLEEECSQHRLTAKPPYLVVVGDVNGTRVKRRSLEQLVYEAVGVKITPDEAE